LAKVDRWRSKARTAKAMLALSLARLLVEAVPFKHWRNMLGSTADPATQLATASERAKLLAADVEWAAKKLPFATKCLPRAMALSLMLRRQRLPHAMVIAGRPADLRQTPDALHAWVEMDGEKIIGNLPGPWIEFLRVGAKC
jgi:hypothetical protein